MTKFEKQNPRANPGTLHKSLADRIKTVTGIDVLTDGVKLQVDYENGEISGFDINMVLSPSDEAKILIEFPELRKKGA